RQGWSIDELEEAINALQQSLRPGSPAPITVYAMGTDAAVFGHNAPNWNTLPHDTQAKLAYWESDTLGHNASTSLPWLDLDNVYPVTVGDQVALAFYARSFPLTARSVITTSVRPIAAAFGAASWLAGAAFSSVPSWGQGHWETFFTTVTDVNVV